MTNLRKKRDRRDYQIKRFMMCPPQMIVPEYLDSPSGPEVALINGVWSLPEPPVFSTVPPRWMHQSEFVR